MKQELIDELTKKALTYLNSAEAFASKEVPIYVNELLTFEIISNWVHLIFLLLGLLLCACVPYFVVKLCKQMVVECNENATRVTHEKKCLSDYSEVYVPVYGISALIAIVLVCVIYADTINLIKANYTPRVFLMEKLRR